MYNATCCANCACAKEWVDLIRCALFRILDLREMAAEESVSPSESRAEEWLGNWTPLAVDYGEYDPLRAGSIDGTDRVPHDRAIVRAMTVNCKFTSRSISPSRIEVFSTPDKPPKDLKSDPYHTVFVGRINHDTTEGLNSSLSTKSV